MMARRVGSCSTRSRNTRAKASSGRQETYSGGSNAGKRRMKGVAEELAEQPAAAAARGLFAARRVRELHGGGIAVVGTRLHRAGEGLLEILGQVGPELPQRGRRAAQARDHHL